MNSVTAILCGIIGSVLTFWIGAGLGLSVPEMLLCLAATSVACVVSGILTLQAERLPWLKARVLRGGFRTWTLLAVLYFGTLAAVAEPLRRGEILIRLAFPLILATGFAIQWAFGPLQDRIVRRQQRRLEARAGRG